MTGASIVVWILIAGNTYHWTIMPLPQMFADRNACLIVKEAVKRQTNREGECVETRVILPVAVINKDK